MSYRLGEPVRLKITQIEAKQMPFLLKLERSEPIIPASDTGDDLRLFDAHVVNFDSSEAIIDISMPYSLDGAPIREFHEVP